MPGEHFDPKSLGEPLQPQDSLWMSPATVKREAASDKIISQHQNGVRMLFPGFMGSGGEDMGWGTCCSQPVRDLEVAYEGEKRAGCPALSPLGAGNVALLTNPCSCGMNSWFIITTWLLRPWGSTASGWERGGLDFLPTSICVVQGGSVNGLVPQFPPLQASNALILLTVPAINIISQAAALEKKNLLLLPVKPMTVNEEN